MALPAKEEITSPRNALVRLAVDLGQSRRERESHGLSVLEGVRLAGEAQAARVQVAWFFYTRDLLEKERGRQAVTGLMATGARGFCVSAEAMQRAAQTETPQGLLAAFRPPQWQPEDVPGGLVLVAEGIADPGNLGTMVRTAQAMGAVGLCLVGGADPWAPKVVRAAMGSLFRLPLLRYRSTAELVPVLKGRGCRVLVADRAGAMHPWQADLAGDVALVVGSEAEGVSQAARAAAHGVVTIPMPGGTESLNAAVAAAVLLYESLRQRQ